jgi:hypothetical protein
MRNQYLLDWFETQLIGADGAFVPGVISAQDILLTCVCQVIATRLAIVPALPWATQARVVGRSNGKTSFSPTGSRTLEGARGDIRHCCRGGEGKT